MDPLRECPGTASDAAHAAHTAPHPDPRPAPPSRRGVLAGLGMAAAVPLVLGAGRTQPRGGTPTGRAAVLRNAALVLTMDRALGEGPLGAVEQADVLMRDGLISAVGKRLPPRPAPR